MYRGTVEWPSGRGVNPQSQGRETDSPGAQVGLCVTVTAGTPYGVQGATGSGVA